MGLMVESITNPTFYVWRSLRHHKIFPFRDIILKDADRRVQEFKSKYPWYTNDYCILPVHAYNTLTEFLRLRGQDHFKRVHQIPYERELATIKKAPKISELRSLLHYETEYGIVWDGKGWHAIAGDDRCVPFNGRDFPDNGIFIHNHLLKIKDDLRNGFLADALLANWDVAANFGNVISSGGRLIRIDNGGALLFRARGERKSGFGGIVTELESMKGSYLGLTQEDIQNQLSSLREKFTDGAIDQLVDSVRLSTKDRDYVKTTLRQRRDYIFAYYNSELPTAETREISEQARAIDTSLRAENFDETKIREAIPEWEKLTSEEGYQHNGVLLGDHIRNVVSSLKYLPEYWSLSEREKSLALVATLFHDIGKPTGRQDEDVPRDFEHEIPSAQIAAEYMRTWGYSDSEIRTVVQVIINDGIVSDIVRGKVRDERKNLTPEQFRGALRNNPSAIKILRALNRADVIATVGTEGFNAIANAYNQYFDQGLS